MVVKCFAEPNLAGCQPGSKDLIWQKIQEPLTSDNLAIEKLNMYINTGPSVLFVLVGNQKIEQSFNYRTNKSLGLFTHILFFIFRPELTPSTPRASFLAKSTNLIDMFLVV